MALFERTGERFRGGAHAFKAVLETFHIGLVVEDLLLRIAREEIDGLRVLDEREDGFLVATRERHPERVAARRIAEGAAYSARRGKIGCAAVPAE